MSKKTYFILFLIIIGLSWYFNLDKLIQNKSTGVLNNIKLAYVEKLDSIKDSIDVHFNQSEKIKELTLKNEELEKYKLLYNELSNKYNNFENFNDSNNSLKNVNIVSVLSYSKYDDFTKVYIDTHDINTSNMKIGALISDNYAAGILVKDEGKSIGLLNGNQKSNYAVYIGKAKAPGITHSLKNKKEIVVKFIPNWLEIDIDDEVYTSGMDGIFFEGLKVGRVVSVKKIGDTQEAIVEPYADTSDDSLYYLYYRDNSKNKSTKN